MSPIVTPGLQYSCDGELPGLINRSIIIRQGSSINSLVSREAEISMRSMLAASGQATYAGSGVPSRTSNRSVRVQAGPAQLLSSFMPALLHRYLGQLPGATP